MQRHRSKVRVRLVVKKVVDGCCASVKSEPQQTAVGSFHGKTRYEAIDALVDFLMVPHLVRTDESFVAAAERWLERGGVAELVLYLSGLAGMNMRAMEKFVERFKAVPEALGTTTHASRGLVEELEKKGKAGR